MKTPQKQYIEGAR